MSKLEAISNVPFIPSVNAASVQPQSVGFSDTLSQRLKVPANLNSIFEEAAQKYQVPSALLKAVTKAESDFNPNAVSRSGAQGLMQLMPATARELGVSNSFDPRENIMGGAKYLSDMLRKYDGNTKLALAAYNAGSNNVDKYNGIPPFKETQNYVVKIMKYLGDGFSTVPSTARTTGGYASAANPYAQNSYAPYVPGNSSSYDQDLLQDVLNFDDYTEDDYLLLLELLKSGLKTPGIDFASEQSSSLYQGLLLGDRMQTLF